MQMQVAGLDLQSSINEPTNVLCLLNMVSEDELMDDEEYDGRCSFPSFISFLVLLECYICCDHDQMAKSTTDYHFTGVEHKPKKCFDT